MKIKLDENLSGYLKPILMCEGHEVSTVKDEGLLGKCDTEVAFAAREESRVLFTLDLEFADLRKFPPGSHSGVVLFRPRSMGPRSVNEFILRFVKDSDLSAFSGCVVVVDPERIRVRSPHPDVMM